MSYVILGKNFLIKIIFYFFEKLPIRNQERECLSQTFSVDIEWTFYRSNSDSTSCPRDFRKNPRLDFLIYLLMNFLNESKIKWIRLISKGNLAFSKWVEIKSFIGGRILSKNLIEINHLFEIKNPTFFQIFG